MMFKVIVAAALVACTLGEAHNATKSEAEIVAAFKTKCADFGEIVVAAGNATAVPAATEPAAAAGNATAAPAATEPAAATAATGSGDGSADGSADGSGATKPDRSRRAAHAESCKALVAEYKTLLGCAGRSRRAAHAAATCALLKTAEEAVDKASATTTAAATTIAATESSASTLAAGFSAAVAVAVAQLC